MRRGEIGVNTICSDVVVVIVAVTKSLYFILSLLMCASPCNNNSQCANVIVCFRFVELRWLCYYTWPLCCRKMCLALHCHTFHHVTGLFVLFFFFVLQPPVNCNRLRVCWLHSLRSQRYYYNDSARFRRCLHCVFLCLISAQTPHTYTIHVVAAHNNHSVNLIAARNHVITAVDATVTTAHLRNAVWKY